MQDVEWGEYRLGDLFNSSNGDFDIQRNHINGKGEYVITAGLKETGIMGKTDIAARVFKENTITVDMFGYAFYRGFKYKMVTHARVFSLEAKFKLTESIGIFIVSTFHFLNSKFGYENMCSWEKIKNEYIKLPTKNGEIDFAFMESFITDIEVQRVAELKAYLLTTGLKDYELTDIEKQAIENYDNLVWSSYNLKELFGKATRGKRLKSADRIDGELPFVTAGETNEGISGFIGNKVQIFSKNTTTIDMFGSAKYRNYNYGGDDHIAVVHTEDLPKRAAIFVTTSIHKSSNNGQFNYGKNFYAKDADELNIILPEEKNKPDYRYMENLISAVQKLVIKDVVLYTNSKIESTKKK